MCLPIVLKIFGPCRGSQPGFVVVWKPSFSRGENVLSAGTYARVSVIQAVTPRVSYSATLLTGFVVSKLLPGWLGIYDIASGTYQNFEAGSSFPNGILFFLRRSRCIEFSAVYCCEAEPAWLNVCLCLHGDFKA